MNSETKLILIKSIHTAIWLFFNVVIFYMLYAAIARKLDVWASPECVRSMKISLRTAS